ncbi:MAG: C40 family peptidase [Bacteroidota bacterium]|nr:C40 family peptidase [Bacteroidota bacterium]
MNKINVYVLFGVLFFYGCTEKTIEQKPTDPKILALVREVQKKYAPDKRVAIFNIKTVELGNTLIVSGEVGQEEAKKELFDLLSAEKKELVDSVIVLPDEKLGNKTYGIITVSVANMRSDPGEDAELGSQVLMGSIVRILKKKGGWVYIQSPDKYLGWADPDQMIRVSKKDAEEWSNAKKVFVTDYFGFIQQQPTLQSFPVCDITGGALLKDLGTTSAWTKVGLADGRVGYIQKSNVIEYQQWGTKLTPVADNIERTGKYLMGVPYLWGGTSPKGVDCSGFTKTVFLLNGQLLNRDANQQAEQGEPIEPGAEFENLKKGDLLFFGRKAENDKPEKIVHVGIYLGNREYIHSSGKVHLSSFDSNSPIFEEYNLKRFVRARRVIASTPRVAEVRTH